MRSVLIFTLLLAVATTASAAKEGSAAELERVRSRIGALAKTIEREREQRDALDAQMEEAEKQLSAAMAQVKQFNRDLASRQVSLTKAQTQRDALEKRLKGERRVLASQLRAAYLVGQREQTKLLLSQQSALNVGRMLTYYDYFTRSRTQRLASVVADSRALAETIAQVKTEIEAFTLARTQQQQAVKDEQVVQRQRQALMANLMERLGDEQDQLKRLTADERDMAKALELVRSTLTDLPVTTPKEAERDGTPARSFGQGRGRMGWPLRGGLIAKYGDPKVGGKLAWKGLWIAADRGAAARASARGRVAYVGYMHRYGLIVIVEHEDAYFTLYGHLDEANAKAGDTVTAGQSLGTAGDSGGHDRTGVYFEVRKGTEPMDPRDWLAP